MCVCVREREREREIQKCLKRNGLAWKCVVSTAIFGISAQGVAGVTVSSEPAATPQSESHMLHEM